jgi:hypothetical protein
MKKKEILPIGTSDFRELRRDGSYYIDKTLAIKELIENNTRVYLLPRPRRFGKTLLQTTFLTLQTSFLMKRYSTHFSSSLGI